MQPATAPQCRNVAPWPLDDEDGGEAELMRRIDEATELFLAADAPGAWSLWQETLAIFPYAPSAYCCAGPFLQLWGKFPEADMMLRQAINKTPKGAVWEAELRATLALTTLAAGRDIPAAWDGLRWRKSLLDMWLPDPTLEWRGGIVPKGRLVIINEQGFGDEIMLLRFALDLRARGFPVVLCASAPLASLFGSTGLEIIPRWGGFHEIELTPEDRWCLPFDLPARGGYRYKNLPPAPYVTAPDPLPIYGARIGVKVSGNPDNPRDRLRSLPEECEERLLSLDGAISLEPQPDQSFETTAAIIAGLDLVISADTSVAHLAGAMGKPVWILLPDLGCDWRWMRRRDDTPWYPSARLFRQERPGDWAGVLDRIQRQIDDRRTESAPNFETA